LWSGLDRAILGTLDAVPPCNRFWRKSSGKNVIKRPGRADVMHKPDKTLAPCVLVVEQNAIIGLSLAEDLEDQGYQVAGPFACAGALGWLQSRTPELVILDADLQSGSCVELARLLKARQVPFLVFTSHDQRNAAAEFRDAPWVMMPAEFGTLLSTLRTLPVCAAA
jgi:CheY-like chemotaxis protein